MDEIEKDFLQKLGKGDQRAAKEIAKLEKIRKEQGDESWIRTIARVSVDLEEAGLIPEYQPTIDALDQIINEQIKTNPDLDNRFKEFYAKELEKRSNNP